MSAAKHTPGPWTAHPPHGGDPDADGDEYQWVIRAPHTYAISFQLCKLSSSNTSQVEHDARLIAAAPELLEALQSLMYWDNGKPEFEIARAVLAKAAGETA